MDLIAKSSPDGYTFGIAVPSVMVINPFVYKNLPFKAMEDLAPISQTTSITFALVTNPKLPVRNVQELIQYAKKSAVELNYSSAGVGNLQHLAAELLSLKTAIKLNHIPNKGDTPAMTDVMAGNTDFMFVPLPSAINHIKSGKLKLIAVASKKRVIQFPDVPTLSEDGLPDLIIEGWLGLVAPTGTPTQIIEEIQKMTAQIILEPTVKKGIEAQGFEVVASSPKEFKEFLLQESAKWSSVIQKSNIKLGD
jgi:tripartite-type tricarboxylate transporter receptor subunit TctC